MKGIMGGGCGDLGITEGDITDSDIRYSEGDGWEG